MIGWLTLYYACLTSPSHLAHRLEEKGIPCFTFIWIGLSDPKAADFYICIYLCVLFLHGNNMDTD